MTKGKRVVVALSGGVDSAVAAALLKEDGYDVIGMTMKIWPKATCGYDKKRACCSLEGIADARLVAEKLGIPYYVMNLEGEFKKEVIDYFCEEYIEGRTPNPCIVCNERMKFGYLLTQAKKVGASLIATGHHARLGFDKKSSRYLLKKGKDKAKDQAYVLFSLTQEQLSHVMLPIGNLTKHKVRTAARKLGLRHVSRKLSSQEICFIPDDNYPRFVTATRDIKPKKGPIVSVDGSVLGEHKGILFYTIGQRRGLGIAHRKPLYVVKINKDENTIVVGEKEDLRQKSFVAVSVNWISIKGIAKPLRFKVKIRYNHKGATARIKDMGGEKVLVKFSEAQEAITPGQAAVFYKGDTVVGGGWIRHIVKES